ncbi:hypothetical protein EDM59_22790 [Brevibacillus nitrificans]|uniref:Uncharacterized protein n=2 Tax=Brevibacillus nitrificans TaxID=651560 RepID=A0A3M8D064_9BACL|nr:hypothetical protein EDM59_22790 [Brevibacillus nitrificans]
MLSHVKKGMLLGTVVAMCTLGTIGCSNSANGTETGQNDQAAAAGKHGGDRSGGGPGGGPGAGRMERGGFDGGISYKDNADLQTLLKLDGAKLDEQLKAGLTLAEVAKAQGVDENSVIDLLVKQQETKWNEAVAAGKMTQEQVDSMKENASERIKEQIERTAQERGTRGGMGFVVNLHSNAELASLLKLDADKLQEQLKSGKTLADVASAQGVAKEEVVALLTKQQKDQLDSEVASGKLSQEEADKRGADLETRVKSMVDGTFAQGGNMEKRN